jgi:hypothetical protein
MRYGGREGQFMDLNRLAKASRENDVLFFRVGVFRRWGPCSEGTLYVYLSAAAGLGCVIVISVNDYWENYLCVNIIFVSVAS